MNNFDEIQRLARVQRGRQHPQVVESGVEELLHGELVSHAGPPWPPTADKPSRGPARGC